MTNILLTIAGVLVGVVGAYFSYRSVSPRRRRLTISALPSAPLIAQLPSSSTNVIVTVDGNPVANPQVVTVTVANTGNRDIGELQFDGGQPIRIALGAWLIKILQSTVTPERGTPLPAAAESNVIEIGPGLLSRGQVLQVQALVDGTPQISDLRAVTSHDLADVHVEFRGSAAAYPRLRVIRLIALVSGASAGIAVALIMGIAVITAPREGHVSISPDHGAPGSEVVVRGTGFSKYALVEVDIDNTQSVAFDQTKIGSTQADGHGKFILTATIPPKSPVGPTSLEVTVKNEYDSDTEYADFAVVPNK